MLLLIVGACSRHAAGFGGQIRGPRDVERKFDPLAFPEDKQVITGRCPERGMSPCTATGHTLNGSQSTVDFPNDTTAIFRVQVFATKSFDEAAAFARGLEDRFAAKVIVEYNQPYYKVRIGEFSRVSEGQEFLERVKKAGFDGAWLVKTRK